jgi:hypothetical protein
MELYMHLGVLPYQHVYYKQTLRDESMIMDKHLEDCLLCNTDQMYTTNQCPPTANLIY